MRKEEETRQMMEGYPLEPNNICDIRKQKTVVKMIQMQVRNQRTDKKLYYCP